MRTGPQGLISVFNTAESTDTQKAILPEILWWIWACQALKEGSSHKLAYAKKSFLSLIQLILLGTRNTKIDMQENLVGGCVIPSSPKRGPRIS